MLDALAAQREVIAVELPGYGETPPLSDEVSIATLADSVTVHSGDDTRRGSGARCSENVVPSPTTLDALSR